MEIELEISDKPFDFELEFYKLQDKLATYYEERQQFQQEIKELREALEIYAKKGQ